MNYPADVPPGARISSAAQPGLRRMPNTICFSYPRDAPRTYADWLLLQLFSDVPAGDVVEPDPGGPRKMPNMCFRY